MHTPNTVFFLITPAGTLGTTVLFLDRTTNAQVTGHIEGLPEGFRATQMILMGGGTSSYFHTTDLAPAAARTALEAAGFVAHQSIGGPAPAQAPAAWTPPPEEPLLGPESLMFAVRQQMGGPEGTTPTTRVWLFNKAEIAQALEDEDDIFDSVGLHETLLGQGQMLSCPPGDRWMCVSAYSVEATRAALLAVGMEEFDQGCQWLTPAELSFAAWEGEDGETTLFILPKDEDHPCFDNLGGDLLQTCPDWIGIQDMENTWTIEGKTPEEVRAILIARGYTEDTNLAYP